MNLKEKLKQVAELCYGETGREIIHQFEQEELGYYDYKENCSFPSAISRLCNTYYPVESPQYKVLKDTIQAIAKYYEEAYPKERLDHNQNFTLEKQTNISDKLTKEGKKMFQRAKFPEQIKLDGNRVLVLTANGTVKVAYGFNTVATTIIHGIKEKSANTWVMDHDDALIGQSLEDAVPYLIKEEQLSQTDLKKVKGMLEPYYKQKQFETDVKTAILYQIMNNDQTYYGTRRAYLFALEYKGDLSIPIQYGLSTKDPNLQNLIQHYKKTTNQDELRCYPNQIGRKPETVKDYSIKTMEKSLKPNRADTRKRV